MRGMLLGYCQEMQDQESQSDSALHLFVVPFMRLKQRTSLLAVLLLVCLYMAQSVIWKSCAMNGACQS